MNQRAWTPAGDPYGAPFGLKPEMMVGYKGVRMTRTPFRKAGFMSNQGKQAREVLIPIEQDTVPFYGRELVAVLLEDGRICAVLRWFCDGLHLNPSGQIERIRLKTALADGLVTVRETKRLPQPLTYATIYGRLKHRFRVGSYSEVADSHFDELMAYL